MNKKITISELSQLLSTNVSLINKKGWEDFLRLFFAQISEGLQADGNVKIKGLGTFKVVTVDARKSKDVNTGENTIIPAHNKISFTPDSSLAETLNKPYAHFEPTYVLAPEGEVDAPESDEDEESTGEESKAEPIIEETKAEPIIEETKAEPVIEETKAEPIIEETKAEPVIEETKAEPVIEETKAEPVIEETKAEPVIEETKAEPVIEETKAEPVIEEQTIETPGDEPEDKAEEDSTADEDENIDTTPTEMARYAATVKRHDIPTEDDNEKNHGKKLGIAIILFLLILAVVGLVAWISDPNIVSKIRAKITGNDEVKTEIAISPTKSEDPKEIEDQVITNKAEIFEDTTVDSLEKNEVIESETDDFVEESAAKQEIKLTTRFKEDFVNYMKTKHPEMDITEKGDPVEEKLGNASRLTLVSLRHYGAKDFWVYIYLYNKDVIKNPNYIKAGTKIKIPSLDNKKFVNPDSEHSILTAKEVQHEFVK